MPIIDHGLLLQLPANTTAEEAALLDAALHSDGVQRILDELSLLATARQLLAGDVLDMTTTAPSPPIAAPARRKLPPRTELCGVLGKNGLPCRMHSGGCRHHNPKQTVVAETLTEPAPVAVVKPPAPVIVDQPETPRCAHCGAQHSFKTERVTTEAGETFAVSCRICGREKEADE